MISLTVGSNSATIPIKEDRCKALISVVEDVVNNWATEKKAKV